MHAANRLPGGASRYAPLRIGMSMRPRPLISIALFLGSYFPLSVILLLQDVKRSAWNLPICSPHEWFSGCYLPALETPARSLVLFSICAVSLAIFFGVLFSARPNHVLHVVSCKAVPNDLINYVFPYIVAFMVLDFADTGKYYGFWLFLVWMFLITYRSGQLLMNPILIVAGWQLYEIEAIIDSHATSVRAISRFKPDRGRYFHYFGVQNIRILLKEETNAQSTPAPRGAPTA